MATISTDIKIVIDGSAKQGPLTGTLSGYVDNIHPGSGQQIKGWQYDNRFWPGTDSEYTSAITGLTDPDLSKVASEHFQSGTGIDNDCLVKDLQNAPTTGFVDTWTPDVNHGKWFDHEKEYYLFSDQVRAQYAKVADVMTGCNFIDMAEFPKDGVPILSRIFQWDEETEQYLVYKNYVRKVYFTGTKATPTSPRESTWDDNAKEIIFANIDDTKDEFILVYDGYTIPRIVFNKNVITAIGHTVSSGADLLDLEEMGIGDGTDKLLFHTQYSPIEKTQVVQVYTYTSDINTYQLWTARINTSLIHSGHECIVDTDLGTVQFGSVDDGDIVPPVNAHVLIRYSYTTETLYETTDSKGIHTAFNREADCNPVSRTNDRGFIIISRNELQPYTVALEADTDLISLDTYGPINIGNVLLPLRATVLSRSGIPIEHIRVTFELLDSPLIGHFTNGTGLIYSYTNNLGIATTYYNTPNSLDDISELVTISGYDTSGGNTILSTANLKLTSTLRDIFVYSVWKDDFVQGVDIGDQGDLDAGLLTTELSDFYKTFFTAESIFGPTGNDPGTGDPEGALQSGASWWENRRRIIEHILTPTSYNRLLRNGRKQIVSHWDATALDPHYDEAGALVPLTPTSVTPTGGSTHDIQYNGVVLTAPGTGDLDAYLVISPTSILVRASVIDQALDKIIYSNTITIELEVADALNGTVYVDDINDIPAGVVPYVLNGGDNGKILPLGFRIRETGITLASAVQRVTYVDINQPATLTMTFNVDKLI